MMKMNSRMQSLVGPERVLAMVASYPVEPSKFQKGDCVIDPGTGILGWVTEVKWNLGGCFWRVAVGEHSLPDHVWRNFLTIPLSPT